jgi:O-acetyl-ADP-ribose deacetylase (regulator of RNase III)
VITEVTGDIMAADVEAIVNPVNTVGVMGKGLALQIKERWPHVDAEYIRACRAGTVRLGCVFPVLTNDHPELVINFPTKVHWALSSRLEYIERGLRTLVRLVEGPGSVGPIVESIAIPRLGCGNGGLIWTDVAPLIRSAFAHLETVDVRLYSPTARRKAKL